MVITNDFDRAIANRVAQLQGLFESGGMDILRVLHLARRVGVDPYMLPPFLDDKEAWFMAIALREQPPAHPASDEPGWTKVEPNDQQINPNSPLAETIYALFRIMGDSQRKWQDTIGFGEEGHRLRKRVHYVDGHIDDAAIREEPHANLRNYYLTKLALIMTEAGEAIEELRNNHAIDETYYLDAEGHRFSPEEAERAIAEGMPFKPEGVPSELADIVIRVWSLIGETGIDLGPMIVEKLNYNATRAQRHGGKAI